MINGWRSCNEPWSRVPARKMRRPSSVCCLGIDAGFNVAYLLSAKGKVHHIYCSIPYHLIILPADNTLRAERAQNANTYWKQTYDDKGRWKTVGRSHNFQRGYSQISYQRSSKMFTTTQSKQNNVLSDTHNTPLKGKLKDNLQCLQIPHALFFCVTVLTANKVGMNEVKIQPSAPHPRQNRILSQKPTTNFPYSVLCGLPWPTASRIEGSAGALSAPLEDNVWIFQKWTNR